ncbi:MAG: sigma-54-dependent Fis family transcriptional regulator [Deltaproteobacteria bacterium]|nr:sigma-54-dependent Fis family transcriptional regulator [Deltaproteobacteria bacterium]MBW2661482.1 sigma-54-dependent Fis family transcriptional regulator [Deltaproteobacteria bacterium]
MLIRIAVIDDEPLVLRNLQRKISKSGYEVETFQNPQKAMYQMGITPFDIILTDLHMPGMDGMQVLKKIKKNYPKTEVIIITGYASIENAVEAVKQGAFYYIEKPFTPEQVMLILNRALDKVRLVHENKRLKEDLLRKDNVQKIIGFSSPVHELIKIIQKVSRVNCNVLIQGESGTGKELAARAIHFGSPRKDKPYISFNCGSFTEELISNELFGHEKGAFTGAENVKTGLLEAAQSGSVFLDEIGEMPLSMQVKLLRVIQEKKLLRVGGSNPVDLDIRVISATNKELENEIKAGRFREDLYFRLKVVKIRVPSLRERKKDIPVLIEHFIDKYNNLYNKNIKGFTKQAIELLMKYSFPGNIRELEHIVSSAIALGEGTWIDENELPEDIDHLVVETVENRDLLPLYEEEKAHIIKVLEATNYNKARASKILAIPRTTLWRKIKKYNILESLE